MIIILGWRNEMKCHPDPPVRVPLELIQNSDPVHVSPSTVSSVFLPRISFLSFNSLDSYLMSVAASYSTTTHHPAVPRTFTLEDAEELRE